MKPRYLTKSRFKTGCECPSKLVYLDDPAYGSKKIDNSFLEALAAGGFQVGELAKVMHPGGIEVRERAHAAAAEQTAALLAKAEAVIFEAAFLHDRLFVRTDVAIKRKSSLEIIEVKSKTFNPAEDQPFYTIPSVKKGKPQLNAEWAPYIFDVAFQVHVARLAYPDLAVTGFLLLPNKAAKASTDGVNQRFYIDKDERGFTKVTVAPGTTPESIGDALLIKVPVDAAIEVASSSILPNGLSFSKTIELLADLCAGSPAPSPSLGPQCKTCEFRIDSASKASGLKSGFDQCWSASRVASEAIRGEPMVFDVWNFRSAGKLMESDVLLMAEIDEDDLNVKPNAKHSGLSQSERQALQIQKVRSQDGSIYFDRDGLRAEMDSWRFPLHFIDFETTTVALPFNKGRRPYEQIAFQFSHHEMDSSGRLAHKDEYLNFKRGHFPNFDFVRALKKALENDGGTIFRYALHENTVLDQIKMQLLDSNEPDSDELIRFIEEITKAPEKGAHAWSGKRAMVDLLEMVKRFYFDPVTRGSNSLKDVLPAVLNASSFLKGRYGHAIYGAAGGIPSKNFSDWQWIRVGPNGVVTNPYKLLPPIFSDLDLETMDSLIVEGSIADGGAAMTAYARMQFSEMGDEEAKRVGAALLKYCELDTLAMAFIYEHWRNELG